MRKLDDLFKAEWEPFVGPRDGVGWRNVDTGEEIYEDEPPGEPQLPDGYDLETDVEIEDIVASDVILYGTDDGDITYAEADNVPANVTVFGLLEESESDEDSESEESQEPEESEGIEYTSGDDAKEYLENEVGINFDKYDVEFVHEQAVEYRDVFEDAVTLSSSDEFDESMNVVEALVYENENTYVSAYKNEKILEAIEDDIESDGFDEPADVEGTIPEDEYANIPEATTVTISADDVVTGRVTDANPYTITIVDSDNETHKFSNSLIDSIEGHGLDDPEAYETTLPEDPSDDEVLEFADELLVRETDGNHLSSQEKANGRNFLEQTFEENVNPELVFEQINEFAVRNRDIQRMMSTLVDTTVSAESINDEVKPIKDRDVANVLRKLYRSFQESVDEIWARETADTAVNAARDWTGNSTNDKTAVMWAAADDLGYDNVPDEVDTSDITQDDIEKYQEYMEHAQEVVRDVFGDEFTVYRGQGGGFGRDKAEQAKTEEVVDTNHRAIASWSISSMIAEDFSLGSGAIWKKKITPEDVCVSMMSGAGFDYESEIVAMAGREEYESSDDLLEADEAIVPADEVSKSDAFVETWQQYQNLMG